MLRAAIEAADRALPAWRKKTAKERAAAVRRWHELMLQHQEDLARLMTTEQGKPLTESNDEVLTATGQREPLTIEACMTIIMVMSMVNVFEVKAKLSEYLERAARGERIVICRHNRPIAELRAVADVRTQPRPIGPLPGRPSFDVPGSFFEPLSASELDLWDRVTAGDPLSADTPRSDARAASRVAESPRKYARGRRGVRRRP